MEGYLGETPYDLSTHPVYKAFGAKDWALKYIGDYGGIDGDHHKAWVLDQVARLLHGAKMTATEARWSNGHSELRFEVGDPTAEYHTWVAEVKSGEDGPETYDYDVGIPP